MLLASRFNQALDAALAPLSLSRAVAQAVDAQRVRLGGADFPRLRRELRAPLQAAFAAAYVAAFRTLMFASAAAGRCGGRGRADRGLSSGANRTPCRIPSSSSSGATKRYQGKTVLWPFDLKIARGETVALIGPSGSGKTTVLRLALGLLRPDAGVVRFRGVAAGRPQRAATPAGRWRTWCRTAGCSRT